MTYGTAIAPPELQVRGLYSPQLALLAREALVAEAELTPKPGLVDGRGPGAHSDLSLRLMRQSAEALEPFFELMADVARELPLGRALRTQLGLIGRRAEHVMYAAAGGTNTHKGAIWTLGLLVAAASHTGELEPFQLANVAGSIARLPDRITEFLSHGDIVQKLYGVTGARGEAFANFPHVVHLGLPALHVARDEGRSEVASRLCALLAIMAQLDDTCVLYRGGLEAARLVKRGARSVLAAGGPETHAGDAALHCFDGELLARRISPGGSADLLAATILLDSLENSYGTD